MSGGSYNYLCFKTELEELLNQLGDLDQMAGRLAELGYAEDAARETEELLALVRHWKVRAEVRVKRLEGVWKAVEWWDSADWDQDRVRGALAKYRGETCEHPKVYGYKERRSCGFCGETWTASGTDCGTP